MTPCSLAGGRQYVSEEQEGNTVPTKQPLWEAFHMSTFNPTIKKCGTVPDNSTPNGFIQMHNKMTVLYI